MDAWRGNAQDQLQGQIASAKIPLSRMISPQLYWVMTGNDFSLDINKPGLAQNPLRGEQPRPAEHLLGSPGTLQFAHRAVNQQKGAAEILIIIDELPTIYIRGWTTSSPRPVRTAWLSAWAFRTSRSWNATTVTRRRR